MVLSCVFLWAWPVGTCYRTIETHLRETSCPQKVHRVRRSLEGKCLTELLETLRLHFLHFSITCIHCLSRLLLLYTSPVGVFSSVINVLHGELCSCTDDYHVSVSRLSQLSVILLLHLCEFTETLLLWVDSEVTAVTWAGNCEYAGSYWYLDLLLFVYRSFCPVPSVTLSSPSDACSGGSDPPSPLFGLLTDRRHAAAPPLA